MKLLADLGFTRGCLLLPWFLCLLTKCCSPINDGRGPALPVVFFLRNQLQLGQRGNTAFSDL